jgi:hypothetical protein
MIFLKGFKYFIIASELTIIELVHKKSYIEYIEGLFEPLLG